jgi:fructose-specific phosphotransferase system IIC component
MEQPPFKQHALGQPVSKAALTASLATMAAGFDLDAMTSAAFTASSTVSAAGTTRATRPSAPPPPRR